MFLKITVYEKKISSNLKLFFKKVFDQNNRILDMENKDCDLKNISSNYMEDGCFWCLQDEKDKICGTIALRKLKDCYEIRRFFFEKTLSA